MELLLKGKAAVAGHAVGRAIVSKKPISFWGGVSPVSGEIIDNRHDRHGIVITDKIFVFPTGKGSSTGSAVLMEGLRNGSAPAALVNMKLDPILGLGAIVAETIYQKSLPIIILEPGDFDVIQDGDLLNIQPDGSILLTREEIDLQE
jgi:predicted aconitase with swiveling domain